MFNPLKVYITPKPMFLITTTQHPTSVLLPFHKQEKGKQYYKGFVPLSP